MNTLRALKEGDLVQAVVESKHIENALPGATNCPLALALREMFPEAAFVLVGIMDASLSNTSMEESERVELKLLDSARKFVHDFDRWMEHKHGLIESPQDLPEPTSVELQVTWRTKHHTAVNTVGEPGK